MTGGAAAEQSLLVSILEVSRISSFTDLGGRRADRGAREGGKDDRRWRVSERREGGQALVGVRSR